MTIAVGATGAVAGAAAKAADESSWRWAADLGNYTAAWLLAVAPIWQFVPTPVGLAVRAAVFFAVMTVTCFGKAHVIRGCGRGCGPWRCGGGRYR